MRDQDPATNESSTVFGLDRRRVLQAIGAGVGLSALGGLGQAQVTGPAARSPTMAAVQQASGESIHPVFGFSALSPEVEPPVEPDHEVQTLIQPREKAPIPEFFFEPTGLFVEPGDVVQFTLTTPHHNVVAYHPRFGYLRRVPEGVPPFSGPLLPAGGYWLYRFDTPGVYEMNCAPHEVFGMVMRIVAGEVSGPAAQPLPDLCDAPPTGAKPEESHAGPELRPPELTAYTVLTDPALAPERIVENGSVSWDELAPESKQLFIRTVGFPPCADEETGDGAGGETDDSDDVYQGPGDDDDGDDIDNDGDGHVDEDDEDKDDDDDSDGNNRDDDGDGAIDEDGDQAGDD